MRKKSLNILAGILATVLVTSGCGKQTPVATVPPPAVTVARPIQHEVIEWDEYTGRLDAVESVEVRARVSGLIESAPFQEGTNVKKGDVLFTIDARPYQAELDKTLSQIASAEAQIRYWQAEVDRLQRLVKQGAGSDVEFLQAKQNLESNQAARGSAQAAQEAAALNVEWCQVTAPIDGRVNNKVVTPGNLVNGGAGQATLLTTVVSQDPIYCYIAADEASVLKYAELARQGKRISARNAKIPTFMAVASETGFPHEGVVDFVDNRIDPNTGTIRGRGVFPNSDGFLQPGMFARVRIPGSGRYDALLIPDQAIGADQNRRFAMVVGADDVVEMHPVKLGALFGDLRAIESGIKPGDRVIINGLQRARPGAEVAPTEQTFSTDALTLTATGSPATQAVPEQRMMAATAPATAPTGGTP